MHLPVALPSIVIDLSTSYGELGIAVALFYTAYSIGLVVNGALGTRAPLWVLMMAGGLSSGIISMFLPMVREPGLFTLLWGLNGYLQSFAWPSLVKLASFVLSGKSAVKGYAYLSTSWSLGHALVWVFSIWLIGIAGWKTCFLVNGALLALTATTIPLQLRRIQPTTEETRGPIDHAMGLKFLVIYTILVSIMHSASYGARNLLITYLPSYLEEASGSMISSVVLPLMGSIGMILVAPLFTLGEKSRGPIVSAGLLLTTALLLWLFPRAYVVNAAVGLLVLGILSAIIYGNEAQLTTSIPVAASGRKLASLIAGIVDSAGSIGAAIAGAIGGLCMEKGTEGFVEALDIWSLVLIAITPLGLVASSILAQRRSSTSPLE